ncbi:hypothetical protein C7C46_08895 [Streptomyces tateyamensis]|uniref:Uncharacterized protein n=1 Tax=Streptomyces tateyamensis TaxID=565073 RepID=A0A2V4PHJ6_9ACTN|nr:hypothetical protein [Streptomyces tateyamensis]PYC83440.1 hypothetical protein C7C46_08895 [Streptomyces tateyamensis]
MKHSLSISSDGARHTVHIDGTNWSGALRSVSLDLAPNSLPRVVIEPFITEVRHINVEHAEVVMSPTAARLLASLGWTPPAGHSV